MKSKEASAKLGCGHADMLSEVCKYTNNAGLGFENCKKVVSQTKKKIPNNIRVEVADISKLEGVWPDVVFLLQCQVFHDFSDSNCIGIMNSLLKNFPNLKYFIFIDIVRPSPEKNKIFPGF
jgi:hypothetical protein